MSKKNALYTAGIALAVVLGYARYGSKFAGQRHGA